jgi:hypothetical protein
LRTLQLPPAIDLQQCLVVLRDRNLTLRTRRRDRSGFFRTSSAVAILRLGDMVLRLSEAFVIV